MRVCFTFLICFTFIIAVYSDTDFVDDDEGHKRTGWEFSDLDLDAFAFMPSDDGGNGFRSAVIPDSMLSNDANSDFLINASDFDMGETPESILANKQSLDWLASTGGPPCMSDIGEFQSIGKFRAARRDGACFTEPPKTGEREKNGDPSDASSHPGPVEIPNIFTAPGGRPDNSIYPSENDDQCPPSIYGTRKTPMCDSGFGSDFMRYSVLGFVPLEMIEGCLPCTCVEQRRC